MNNKWTSVITAAVLVTTAGVFYYRTPARPTAAPISATSDPSLRDAPGPVRYGDSDDSGTGLDPKALGDQIRVIKETAPKSSNALPPDHVNQVGEGIQGLEQAADQVAADLNKIPLPSALPNDVISDLHHDLTFYSDMSGNPIDLSHGDPNYPILTSDQQSKLSKAVARAWAQGRTAAVSPNHSGNNATLLTPYLTLQNGRYTIWLADKEKTSLFHKPVFHAMEVGLEVTEKNFRLAYVAFHGGKYDATNWNAPSTAIGLVYANGQTAPGAFSFAMKTDFQAELDYWLHSDVSSGFGVLSE